MLLSVCYVIISFNVEYFLPEAVNSNIFPSLLFVSGYLLLMAFYPWRLFCCNHSCVFILP